MATLTEAQVARRERTLLITLLMSAWGPFVTGMAVLSSQSTTQIADFVRRSAELVALFVSWWVFRHVRRKADLSARDRARMERIASLSVAAAMLCSGSAMLLIALSRQGNDTPSGNVTLGLTIALLGLVTNGWFWRRYSLLNHEQHNVIMAAQAQLYRAKTSVDFTVAVALAAVAIAPEHPLTPQLDLLGSLIVAVYLLWSGVRAARS